MTREELRAHCERRVKQFERQYEMACITHGDFRGYEEHKLVLKLLKEDSDAMAFVRWVAEKIFSGMLEEDPELFAELACRRLMRLGIVKATNSKEWQIVGTPLDDMIKKLESEGKE